MANQDFQSFFELNLKEKIASINKGRSTYINNLALGFMFVGISIPFFIYMQGLNKLFGAPFVGIGIYFFFQAGRSWNNLKKEYKSTIIDAIVKFINPDWEYYPKSYIDQPTYYESAIFTRHADRYQGDDFIRGKIGQTDFESSELHTQYYTESSDEDGNTSKDWHTIFHGFFFHADFHKHFSGATFVLPDFSEKTFGNIGRSLQKLSKRGQLIQLENVAFEKEFVVYGTDQIEARYILTPAMMEAMLRIRKRFGKATFFSFIGTRVYCAVSIRSILEPRNANLQFKDVEKAYDLIQMNAAIIEELELNTRIWTKV